MCVCVCVCVCERLALLLMKMQQLIQMTEQRETAHVGKYQGDSFEKDGQQLKNCVFVCGAFISRD